jgi:hypothetical protein
LLPKQSENSLKCANNEAKLDLASSSTICHVNTTAEASF